MSRNRGKSKGGWAIGMGKKVVGQGPGELRWNDEDRLVGGTLMDMDVLLGMTCDIQGGITVPRTVETYHFVTVG